MKQIITPHGMIEMKYLYRIVTKIQQQNRSADKSKVGVINLSFYTTTTTKYS